MRKRSWLVLLLVAATAAFVACSNGDGADKDVADVTVPRTVDVPAPEDVFELFGEARSYEYIPQEGEFLWPCTTNEECDSGY